MTRTPSFILFCGLMIGIGCSSTKDDNDDDDDDWDSVDEGDADGWGADNDGGTIDGGGGSGGGSGDDDGTTADGIDADDGGDSDDDGDSDDGGSDGGSSEDDGDGDGGSEGGESTGGDTGWEPPLGCSHPYNPVDRTSWEKTYVATFISDGDGTRTGTATETGMEPGFTSSGWEAYKHEDLLTLGGETAWDSRVYTLCDEDDGGALSVAEWFIDIDYTVATTGEASPEDTAIPDTGASPAAPTYSLMILSTPRKYLPNVGTIGTGLEWAFAYNLSYTDTTGTGITFSIPVSGTYTDMGLTSIEVMGETSEAWHIRSTYTMDLLTIPDMEGGSSFSRAYPGEANYYWVEGLGLVYEKHVDTETEAIILEKTLTSSVGLGL
jgi:hypothetical protein